MTVRLTVDRSAWLAHVHATAGAYGHGLVPVVKGNGYGFGRTALHDVVLGAGAPFVCVGTVHELHDVPEALRPVVLTPSLTAPVGHRAVLTVGHPLHVQALANWGGSVMLKLRSSMHRYGVPPEGIDELHRAARAAGLTVEAYALHLPLAGDDASRAAEVDAWLPHIEPGVPVWVSHLEPTSFHALRQRHTDRDWYVRVGTTLWHGRPRGPFVHLGAEVLHTEPVTAGQTVGYRHSTVPFDGTLVCVGGGSTHGIAPLDDPDPARRSPFHFAQHRLALLEAPHMHTSLAIVRSGDPCPEVGEFVDVQRPLTTTFPDEVRWE